MRNKCRHSPAFRNVAIDLHVRLGALVFRLRSRHLQVITTLSFVLTFKSRTANFAKRSGWRTVKVFRCNNRSFECFPFVEEEIRLLIFGVDLRVSLEYGHPACPLIIIFFCKCTWLNLLLQSNLISKTKSTLRMLLLLNALLLRGVTVDAAFTFLVTAF